jgi:hypothetical protein
MAGLPKLLLISVVIFAAWYVMRAFNRVRPQTPPPQRPRPMIQAEDLVGCRTCGTYIASSARHCGRVDCPRPR